MPPANLTTLNKQALSALQGMLKKFHVQVWRVSAAGAFDPKVWNPAVIAENILRVDLRFGEASMVGCRAQMARIQEPVSGEHRDQSRKWRRGSWEGRRRF